jgi:hypothetical protein
MRPSVHITTPIEPREIRIKRLRIPKARQKELVAMMDQAWARLAAEKETPPIDSVQPGKKPERASAAD